MIIQFGRPVLASVNPSDEIGRTMSAPTTKKEKEQAKTIINQKKMLKDYESEIMELKKKMPRKNSSQLQTALEAYTGNQKEAELKYKTLQQDYAEYEKKAELKYKALEQEYEKSKKTIKEFEIMQKTNTDFEKINTILSWIIFGLCIALFITICLLYFKYKCCAEQTVKEIIPEVIADRPTRTSLQFMQQDEQKKRSVKKKIPAICKIPKVTADRPTRTSLQFMQQDEQKKRSVKKKIPAICKIPKVTADRPTRTSLQFMQQDEQKQLSVKKTIPSMCKIPKVTADRPTRTSLQFMQQDEQKKRSVKKKIPAICKIPKVTADRPTRTSLQFMQYHGYLSSTSMSASTLFGTETREIAQHHFQPSSSSNHPHSSTQSLFRPNPNDIRSNQHFQLTRSSQTLSNNDL
jgi:hypothetical protein